MESGTVEPRFEQYASQWTGQVAENENLVDSLLIWAGMAESLSHWPGITNDWGLLMISFIFTGLFPAVGVYHHARYDCGEKREGTASWVLSKPLTRLAFVLSKVIANSVGVMVTMIIVPFCISFTIIAIVHKSLLEPIRFHRSDGSGIH